MKATINVLIIGILLLVTTSVFAQKDVQQGFQDEFQTAPIVPEDVVIKGRDAVTSYLLKQIDYVVLSYTGRSVVGAPHRYIGREELKERGYIHAGSFTEFADVISKIEFSHEIVRTPQGYFDVSVEITARGSDGRSVLHGRGYLDDNEFHPYVWIPQMVVLKADGDITGASWISPEWRNEDLSYQYIHDNTEDKWTPYIMIPVKILGAGYLVVAGQGGNVEGVDLSTGKEVVGVRLIAVLGQVRSSDVLALKDPGTLSLNWEKQDIRFYKSNGKIYGRFPLLDVATSQPLKEVFFPTVRVWGTDQLVSPSRIVQKVLWVNDPARFDQPAEYNLPFAVHAGGWGINAPPGGYHIEVKFDQVSDPDDDQNPRG